MGWQPIKTAPRDGTRVLAIASRLGWESDGPAPVVAAYRYNRWWVMGATGAGFDSKDTCEPTRWQHIPPQD